MADKKQTKGQRNLLKLVKAMKEFSESLSKAILIMKNNASSEKK